MDRKQTAWKKNRKFGDVYGGRTTPKIPDRIWRRVHSLKPPTPHDELPIFIVDNPSRDFFFPLSPDEIRRELGRLPQDHWRDITHVWLRRIKNAEYDRAERPFAEFLCGSAVRAVVLYPWPQDMLLYLGRRRPGERILRPYAQYASEVKKLDDGWYLQWSLPDLKNFYVEFLLYHEIGHNIDWYSRLRSRAAARASEEFADQYAYERTAKRAVRYGPA